MNHFWCDREILKTTFFKHINESLQLVDDKIRLKIYKMNRLWNFNADWTFVIDAEALSLYSIYARKHFPEYIFTLK